MRQCRWIAVAVLALWGALLSVAQAQVPDTFVYTGELSTGEGPIEGEVDLNFEIYDAPTGGTAVFTESFTGVMVVEGHFSVELGAEGDLPTLFDGAQYWLQVTVNDEVLDPRSAITSLPYAFRALAAENATQLDGRSFDEVVEELAVPGAANEVPYEPGEGGLAAENVQAALDEILGRVATLEGGLTDAEATIEAQAATITTLTERLDAAEALAETQEATITALTERLDAGEAALVSQGEALTAQGEGIAANGTAIATNAGAINAVGDRATALEAADTAQDALIEANSNTIDANGELLVALTDRVTGVEEAQVASNAALDALSQTVTGQGEQLGALQNEVAANTQTSTDNFLAINGDGVNPGLRARLANAEISVGAIDNFISVEVAPLTTITDFNINAGVVEDVFFEGVNLHVRNGGGSTYSQNGRGNLIVGYNGVLENDFSARRDGSHNLVVGDGHGFERSGAIVAGFGNLSAADAGSVLGGRQSFTESIHTVIVGGQNNAARALDSVIVGGISNEALGQASVALGGQANDAAGEASVTVGGYLNQPQGEASVIVGGAQNTTQPGAFVALDENGDGEADRITGATFDEQGQATETTEGGALTTILSGTGNSTNGVMSSIVAGQSNQTSGASTVVVAGQGNDASGASSVIMSGFNNITLGNASAVVSGYNTGTIGDASVIVTGFQNVTQGESSVILAGAYNQTGAGTFAPIDTDGDGQGDDVVSIVNDAQTANGEGGALSAIVAGHNNFSNGLLGGIFSGQSGQTLVEGATVLNGSENVGSGIYSSVLNGFRNTASGLNAVVAGGQQSEAIGTNSIVVGGGLNTAEGTGAVVVSGIRNVASGNQSAVVSGTQNSATTQAASVSGGRANTASGINATVGGGANITVSTGDAWAAPESNPDPVP